MCQIMFVNDSFTQLSGAYADCAAGGGGEVIMYAIMTEGHIKTEVVTHEDLKPLPV